MFKIKLSKKAILSRPYKKRPYYVYDSNDEPANCNEIASQQDSSISSSTTTTTMTTTTTTTAPPQPSSPSTLDIQEVMCTHEKLDIGSESYAPMAMAMPTATAMATTMTSTTLPFTTNVNIQSNPLYVTTGAVTEPSTMTLMKNPTIESTLSRPSQRRQQRQRCQHRQCFCQTTQVSSVPMSASKSLVALASMSPPSSPSTINNPTIAVPMRNKLSSKDTTKALNQFVLNSKTIDTDININVTVATSTSDNSMGVSQQKQQLTPSPSQHFTAISPVSYSVSESPIMPKVSDLLNATAKRPASSSTIMPNNLGIITCVLMPKLPLLAKPIKFEHFTPENWIFEEKYDGERLLTVVYNNSVKHVCYTRHLRRSTIFKGLIILKPEISNCIFDGELIYLDSSGKIVPICDTGNRNSLRVQYRIFDIQYMNGLDVCIRPLSERKELLRKCIYETDHVCFSKFTECQSREYVMENFNQVVRNGGEGLVLKCMTEPYFSDARLWLKVKALHLCENRDEFELYARRFLKDKNGVPNILECGYYVSSCSCDKTCGLSSQLYDGVYESDDNTDVDVDTGNDGDCLGGVGGVDSATTTTTTTAAASKEKTIPTHDDNIAILPRPIRKNLKCNYDLNMHSYSAADGGGGIRQIAGIVCEDDYCASRKHCKHFISITNVSSGINFELRNKLKLLSDPVTGFFRKHIIVTIIADRITANKSLRHPSLHRIRTDLRMIDVTKFL